MYARILSVSALKNDRLIDLLKIMIIVTKIKNKNASTSTQ